MIDQAEWIKKAILRRFDEVIQMSENLEEAVVSREEALNLQIQLESYLADRSLVIYREWLDAQETYASMQNEWCYSRGFYDGVQLLVYLMMDGGSTGKTDWFDFRGEETK